MVLSVVSQAMPSHVAPTGAVVSALTLPGAATVSYGLKWITDMFGESSICWQPSRSAVSPRKTRASHLWVPAGTVVTSVAGLVEGSRKKSCETGWVPSSTFGTCCTQLVTTSVGMAGNPSLPPGTTATTSPYVVKSPLGQLAVAGIGTLLSTSPTAASPTPAVSSALASSVRPIANVPTRSRMPSIFLLLPLSARYSPRGTPEAVP